MDLPRPPVQSKLDAPGGGVTRLEYLRRLRGLSPERLAEAMNDGKPAKSKERIAGRTIRRMEAGMEPRAETALRVAQFFEVTPVALLMDVPEAELQGAA